ncbi:hypothetical protein AAG570_002998 [Ranatra chinensis]|uniref:Mos1 transposase HTH domain-containing protein n=1 Tax=Ranatra chinensis TaxID=642074 RepID=A0ABD0Y5G9_9HEMI
MRYDNILKSAEDKRIYRGLELNNGMKVLLISDPTTDKSAAALSVGIGKKAAETCRKICAVYGEDAVIEHVCQKWFSRFRSGNLLFMTHLALAGQQRLIVTK